MPALLLFVHWKTKQRLTNTILPNTNSKSTSPLFFYPCYVPRVTQQIKGDRQTECPCIFFPCFGARDTCHLPLHSETRCKYTAHVFLEASRNIILREYWRIMESLRQSCFRCDSRRICGASLPENKAAGKEQECTSE